MSKETLEERIKALEEENERLKQEVLDLEQIERLLRRSKAWFRAIFEGSAIGIAILNMSGVLIETNPALDGILGYNSEELRMNGMASVIHPEDFAQNNAQIRDLMEERAVQHQSELRLVRKDGQTVWVNFKVAAIQNTEEEFKFIIMLMEDISSRKANEAKQTELLQALEKTNRELDSFAYIVSHDLKAPLRAIGSLATWLSEDYKDRLDENGREILELLTNRVERMKNFIEGILQYSRISRMKGNRTETDLSRVVKDVVEAVAPPPDIEVRIETVLPVIRCEKLRMEQVLQNLLSNAVKFMDKEEGIIRIGCREEGDCWEIYVADNGPGIEEKYHEKIFQIFQTLNARDKFESTGIGLSIVKKIIEMSGGRIWVSSVPGQGSTFTFKVPKHDTNAEGMNEHEK